MEIEAEKARAKEVRVTKARAKEAKAMLSIPKVVIEAYAAYARARESDIPTSTLLPKGHVKGKAMPLFFFKAHYGAKRAKLCPFFFESPLWAI